MKKWLFYLLAACLLAACSGAQGPVQLTGETMGTTWHVTFVPGQGALKTAQVQAGIEQVLAQVNHSMSTYRRESQISAVNGRAPGEWLVITPDFLAVLDAALDVGKKSDGAYDVTVGPLVDLWGFGPAGAIGVPPDSAAIEATLARVGQDKLHLDHEGGRLQKLAALELDFSSLAKGYAVDQVAAWLQGQGISRFMVEVGGEMRLSGLSARGDNWRIAIEQPDSVGRSVATAISLTGAAVATSGDYRNYFEVEGQRYSHMIDPRNGRPVAHDLVSVTVVHPQCMIADAWATALAVLGADQAMAVAQAQGLAVYFIRRVGDELVHSHTPPFSAYLVEPGT